MTARSLRGTLRAAAFGLALACSPLPLPDPVPPFTPTPDADFRARAPRAEPTPLFHPPAVQQVTLENGLTVLVSERPELPYVSLVYANPAAGEHGTGVRDGTATLTLNTLLQSKRGEFAALDGEYPDASLLSEGVTIALDVNGDRLAEGVDLLARMVNKPALDPELREPAILGAVFTSRKQGLLSSRLLEVLYGREGAASLTPIRNEAAFRQVYPAEVQHFYAHQYGPAWSVLVAVGAVKAEQVVELARRSFGGWSSTATRAERPKIALEPNHWMKDQIVGADRRGDTALVALVLPCVGVNDADSLAFDVVATVLGKGMHSRWFRSLRERQGTTYSVHAECMKHAGGGVFVVQFDVKSERIGAALDALLGEISDLGRVPLSDAELLAAKRYWGGRIGDSLGSNRDSALVLGKAFIQGWPPDYYASLDARLSAISATDVQRVIQRYFRRDLMRIAVVGDAPAVHPQLARFGNVLWR